MLPYLVEPALVEGTFTAKTRMLTPARAETASPRLTSVATVPLVSLSKHSRSRTLSAAQPLPTTPHQTSTMPTSIHSSNSSVLSVKIIQFAAERKVMMMNVRLRLTTSTKTTSRSIWITLALGIHAPTR